jgi:hypothetical protein
VAKKENHNGKQTHLQFTNRLNLHEAISHMAMGKLWEALEVDQHGMIEEIRQVRAGDGLIQLLRTLPAYRRYTPYGTSSATVKGMSSLAVSCIDWERGLHLNDEVVDVKNRYNNSGRRDRSWPLRVERHDRWIEGQSRVFIGGTGEPALPTARELQDVYGRLPGCEDVSVFGAGWVGVVGVYRSLHIMTNVVRSDPRRETLLRIHARVEQDNRILEYGQCVRVKLPWR